MPKPTLPPIDPEADSLKDGEDRNQETTQLNSPKIDEESGEITQRAVASFKQAHGICKTQFDMAKEGRLKVAGVVADKYGGSAPLKMADLAKTGQTWRNNFSTNPLGSVTDRSTPQLTDPLKAAEFLTYSALPSERDNAAEKTRNFRVRTTKLVRSWSGFPSLMSMIAQENYLYGNAAPGWIDDDWRPRMFRCDEAFLPEGTAQHASKAQFIVYRQDMLLHDFLQKIEDKQAAEDAGYNMKGCYKAANEAAGLKHGDGNSTPLEQVDAVRESGTLGYSYEKGVKVVRMFHLLVREYNGGVNLWTTTQTGGCGIRVVENIHEGMEDACAFFTLQEGNSKFYGSKGAGRMLANLHIALDRSRNLALDQIYLSGLPILQGDPKSMNAAQTVVRHPFIFVPTGITVAKEAVGFDVSGFQWMDSHLSGLMENLAGAFIPTDTASDKTGATTKIEAAQEATRQLAVKNGVLGRWFGNFSDLVCGMQRKIYKPENLKEGQRLFEENQAKQKKGLRVIAAKVFRWLKDVISGFDKNAAPQEESALADADAVQCIVDLLGDGLSLEDIAELALSPAGNNVEEQPEQQDQKTTSFIDAQAAGPLAGFFDRKEMAKMQATTVLGEDRAERLLLPDQEDPNNEVVGKRNQISEWMAMHEGQQMGVASIDLHKIHMAVMLPMMQPILAALQHAPTKELSDFMKLAIQHYSDHVAADMDMGEDQRKQEEQGIKEAMQIVAGADKKLADLDQQAAAAGVQGGGAALPPQVAGTPMTASGPNGALAGTDGDLERQRLQAETALRLGDQEIQHRKLDIDEQKLAQQDEHHHVSTVIDMARDNAAKTADAAKAGIQDGTAQMQALADRQVQSEAAATARQSAAVNPPMPTGP